MAHFVHMAAFCASASPPEAHPNGGPFIFKRQRPQKHPRPARGSESTSHDAKASSQSYCCATDSESRTHFFEPRTLSLTPSRSARNIRAVYATLVQCRSFLSLRTGKLCEPGPCVFLTAFFILFFYFFASNQSFRVSSLFYFGYRVIEERAGHRERE